MAAGSDRKSPRGPYCFHLLWHKVELRPVFLAGESLCHRSAAFRDKERRSRGDCAPQYSAIPHRILWSVAGGRGSCTYQSALYRARAAAPARGFRATPTCNACHILPSCSSSTRAHSPPPPHPHHPSPPSPPPTPPPPPPSPPP